MVEADGYRVLSQLQNEGGIIDIASDVEETRSLSHWKELLACSLAKKHSPVISCATSKPTPPPPTRTHVRLIRERVVKHTASGVTASGVTSEIVMGVTTRSDFREEATSTTPREHMCGGSYGRRLRPQKRVE